MATSTNNAEQKNAQSNNDQKNAEQKNAESTNNALSVLLPTLPDDMLALEHTFVKSDFYLQTAHKSFQNEHLREYVRVDLKNGSSAYAYCVALIANFTNGSVQPYVYVIDKQTMRFIPKCVALNMSNVDGIYSRRKKSERKAKAVESVSASDLLDMLS